MKLIKKLCPQLSLISSSYSYVLLCLAAKTKVTKISLEWLSFDSSLTVHILGTEDFRFAADFSE